MFVFFFFFFSDFCVGSSKERINDTLPCVYVGYNASGSVEIKDGCLMYAGQKMYTLKELGHKTSTGNDTGKFHMETGRVLFPYIRACNKAARCSKKSLGTVTITSSSSEIETADGMSSLIFTISGDRRKREASAVNILVQTPSGK